MDRTKTLQDKMTQEDLEAIFKCIPSSINSNDIAKGELISFVSRILSITNESITDEIKNEIRESPNLFKKSKDDTVTDIQFNNLSYLCANKISYKEGLPCLIRFVDNNSDVSKTFKFLENILPEFPDFVENKYVNQGNSISSYTLLNAICILMKPKLKEFEGKGLPPIITNNIFSLESPIRDFSKAPGIFDCVTKADPKHFSVGDFINQSYVLLSNQKGFLDWLDKNPEIKEQVESPAPKAYTTRYSATINSEVFIKPEVVAYQLGLSISLVNKGYNLLSDYITKDLYLHTLQAAKKEKFVTYFEFQEQITEFSSLNGKTINSERTENEANQVKEILKLAEHFDNPVVKSLINQYAKSSFPDKELRGKTVNALKACQLESQILTKIQNITENKKDEPTTPSSQSFKL